MTDEKEEEKVEGKETEKPTKDKPENPVVDNDDGGANKEEEKGKPGMVDGAILAAEKLKEQNDRTEALIERQEKLQTQKILGGTTEAGQETEKKKQTPHEYRMEVEKDLAEGKYDN